MKTGRGLAGVVAVAAPLGGHVLRHGAIFFAGPGVSGGFSGPI